MNRIRPILYIFLSAFILLILSCKTETKKPNDFNSGNNTINETFQKTGWLSENKYRAVVFIITLEECNNSSKAEIEEKLKFEAYKNLQKDLNPQFNRNAYKEIRSITDRYGKASRAEKACDDGNVFFYDIEKDNLKSEFEKIRNIK